MDTREGRGEDEGSETSRFASQQAVASNERLSQQHASEDEMINHIYNRMGYGIFWNEKLEQMPNQHGRSLVIIHHTC